MGVDTVEFCRTLVATCATELGVPADEAIAAAAHDRFADRVDEAYRVSAEQQRLEPVRRLIVEMRQWIAAALKAVG